MAITYPLGTQPVVCCCHNYHSTPKHSNAASSQAKQTKLRDAHYLGKGRGQAHVHDRLLMWCRTGDRNVPMGAAASAPRPTIGNFELHCQAPLHEQRQTAHATILLPPALIPSLTVKRDLGQQHPNSSTINPPATLTCGGMARHSSHTVLLECEASDMPKATTDPAQTAHLHAPHIPAKM